MIKYIFLYFTFLLYNQQKCASEIYLPSANEITVELESIIKREKRNIEYLEKNLRRFTDHYFEHIKEIEFDGDFVRQDEIILDALTQLKIKWFEAQHISTIAGCFYDMLSDLKNSSKITDEDTNECYNHADTTFNRFRRDVLAMKKDAKRIINQVTNILNVCQFGKKITEEIRSNCLHMNIPIKALSIIANHSYQYEIRNIDRTDEILQDLRHCNLLAVKPAAEMAQHFLENMNDCYPGAI